MATATKNGTNEAHDKQKKPEIGSVKSCDNKKIVDACNHDNVDGEF